MNLQELKERQAWPLKQKIDHALFTIETFLARTSNNAYVAFSGGKDSTVLLDLVRIIDKTIPAVFVNTGNEWPDIISFVRHLRDDMGYNIVEIHPRLKPKEVWAKHGFPLVSKAQAEYIHGWRVNPGRAQKRVEKAGRKWSFGYVSQRWQFLINEQFDTNNECCQILKKNPSHAYEAESGRYPILGTMASESDQRAMEYISRGGAIPLQKSDTMAHAALPLPSGLTKISMPT